MITLTLLLVLSYVRCPFWFFRIVISYLIKSEIDNNNQEIIITRVMQLVKCVGVCALNTQVRGRLGSRARARYHDNQCVI